MKIITLTKADENLINQAAQLLVDAFREHWQESWTTFEDGLQEVNELLEAEHICRAMIDDDNNLLGMIGGISQYDGNVWELHPLAVQPHLQKKGIGQKLVQDFEEQVRQRGGLTIILGSDDEDNMTSLSDVNIYENLYDKIKNIQNYKGHPFEFYQKMGFIITGIVPDANGIGKPDILMAKRVSR
ncbi:MAG: aminoglycoside N(6')-acetyltransferase [Chloroflexi bacterium OLB14]|nr:MAG: aminoglycoside N(6')-acetyltransferase [Chloroflexi bacterium OLB14]